MKREEEEEEEEKNAFINDISKRICLTNDRALKLLQSNIYNIYNTYDL